MNRRIVKSVYFLVILFLILCTLSSCEMLFGKKSSSGDGEDDTPDYPSYSSFIVGDWTLNYEFRSSTCCMSFFSDYTFQDDWENEGTWAYDTSSGVVIWEYDNGTVYAGMASGTSNLSGYITTADDLYTELGDWSASKIDSTPTVWVTETIEWVSDGTNLQFFTNDSQYFGYFFTCWDTSAYYYLDSFNFTSYIKKNSGASDWGYGVVFGKQNTVESNYYRILFNVNGYWSIQKFVNGVFSYIMHWTEIDSSYGFSEGYGIENRIDIFQDSIIPGKYYIMINQNPTVYFSDDSFYYGYVGMTAYVGDESDETFPGTPVDVRIGIQSPVTMRSPGRDSFVEVGADGMTGSP